MWLNWFFGIYKKVNQVKNNKNIKFLSQDLFNIALEANYSIKKVKKYYLIFEITISSLEDCFSYITIFYPYLIIKIYEMVI